MNTTNGTPRHHVHRKHAAPGAGRAALPTDTSRYLEALERAARLADTEHARAMNSAARLHALGMPTPRQHATDGTNRQALGYPPAHVFGALLDLEAGRERLTRRMATFVAQWYAAGALILLEAMLAGEMPAPHGLESELEGRNTRRPDDSAPDYGAHNRPELPPFTEIATGHTVVDEPMAAAYAALVGVYSAADLLESHNAAVGQAPGTGHRLADDDVAILLRTAGRLHTALITFADTAADAARYGHADPTRTDLDGTPGDVDTAADD